ncbi:MAG: ATP-binding protein [Elusimicrobia bacterium]|nr:ATP-binding protein [Elusimicrobiota bacterium]
MERLLGALLESVHFRSASPRIAVLLGPRGVGKTFLAMEQQKRRGSRGVAAFWDDWEFRKKSISSPYAFLDQQQTLLFKKVLALIDEFAKAPRCWDNITDLYNAQSEKVDFIATSSYLANLSIQNKRFIKSKCSRYRIHPISLSELLKVGFLPARDKCDNIINHIIFSPPDPGRRGANLIDFLLKFGGFPEPFLGQSEKKHEIWLKARRDMLIRDDLREMTRIQQLPGVESLMEMIIPGDLLSFNTLRLNLGVNGATARLWLGHLERLHYCFRVEPYAGKLPRTLRHAAKLYLYDWSAVADGALRFENLVACALLRWCHFAQDWGGELLDLKFVRDKERRSVPFLLTLGGRPRLLVGTTLGEAGDVGHMRYFSERLKVPGVLVALGRKGAGEIGGMGVLPAASFLAAIP